MPLICHNPNSDPVCVKFRFVSHVLEHLCGARVWFVCKCQRDASSISAEPSICRKKISEEVTDMPRGALSFIGWLLSPAYLYWLAPPEDRPVRTLQDWGGDEGGRRAKEAGQGRGGGVGGAVPGWLVLTQIAEISVSVGKLYNLVSTFRRERVPTVTSVLIPSFPFSLPLLLTQSRPDLYV